MKDTQCKKVLQYMEDHGGITNAEAARHFDIYRLSARIFDLRKSGHEIHTEVVMKKNEDGDTVKYAVYSLGETV